MLEYELINPSDPYTFLAADKEVAALAIGCLSLAYGAETQDEAEENRVPIFLFGGYDEWFKKNFGRDPAAGLEARKRDVGQSLSSFMLGRFKDRRRYDAALNAIDDPEKREKFITEWQDGRTSLNDIGAVAHSIGKRLLEVSHENPCSL